MTPIIPKYSNHLIEKLFSSYLVGLHYKLYASVSMEKNHVYWGEGKHLHLKKIRNCYLCLGEIGRAHV